MVPGETAAALKPAPGQLSEPLPDNIADPVDDPDAGGFGADAAVAAALGIELPAEQPAEAAPGMLAADVPVVLRKEVYASACIVGAALFWGLAQWRVPQATSMPVVMLLVIAIRLVCLHYRVGLPRASVAATLTSEGDDSAR